MEWSDSNSRVRHDGRPAIYARVSTDMQESSIETQVDTLRLLAKAYYSCDEPLVFADRQSGKDLERPQLRQLLAMVKRGDISHVLVTRIDRISRSLLDFHVLIDLFRDHGVTLYSKNESFDTSTAMGRFAVSMLVAVAELERERTAERTVAANRARAEAGRWNGGRIPLGYRSNDGWLQVVDDEAAIVRMVFEKYLELRSAAKVATWLNQQGHQQKVVLSRRGRTSGGGDYRPSTVRHLLKNRVYLGEVIYKKQHLPGQHDPIIDLATFEAARAVMEGNANNRRAPTERNLYEYLLTGLVRDADGHALTTSSANGRTNRYHYYRNVHREKAPDEAVDVNLIAAPLLDARVMEHVRTIARSPEVVEAAVHEANTLAREGVAPLEARLTTLHAELEAAERRAVHLVETIANPDFVGSSLLARKLRDVEEQVSRLRATVARAELELDAKRTQQIDLEEVVDAIRNFDRAFKHLDGGEKRELLGLLIKQVVVYPDRAEIEFFDGRDVTAWLTGPQNHETPDVNQGFVVGDEWLGWLEDVRPLVAERVLAESKLV